VQLVFSPTINDAFPITAAHLRALVGPTYYRGEAYWREGRVVSSKLEGRVLTGEVDGSERYRVHVTATPTDGLISRCSCPLGGMCKHAVALVLAYLGERAELPAPERVEGAFATRQELDAWAKEHRVEHALMVSAEPLCAELTFPPQDYWIKTVLARLPVREVGALELAARHARARGVDVALAKAAYRALHREAQLVTDAIAEEAKRPEHHPDPAFAGVWSRLRELRRELREVASPRTRGVRDVFGSWKFDAVSATVTWKEKLRVFRPATFAMATVAAKLGIDGNGVAKLECTCPTKDARCTHVIALIDATLDVLIDPDRAREAQLVAELLLQPGWARALAELDRIETRVASTVPVDVWWKIEGEATSPSVVPVIEKAAKRGKTTGRIEIKIEHLLGDYRHQLRDRDRQIAELLYEHLPSERSTYPAKAFLALVGHPRVIDGDGQPLEIARGQLGFTASPTGEQIQLQPSIDGARVPPKLLTALLAVFADGEPMILVSPEGSRWTVVEVGAEARRLWLALDKHGDVFPPEAHEQLIDRLGRIEARVPVVLPAVLKGKQLSTKPMVVARLRLASTGRAFPAVHGGLEIELFMRAAPNTPLFHPGHGPRDVLVVRDHVRGYVRRDLTNEPETARALFAQLPIFGAEEGPPFCYVISGADEALAAVAAVQDPPPGFEAEWVDLKPHVGGTVQIDKLRVKVERKKDWFNITGDVKVDAARVELAILLDAVRRQQRFVRVDDNRWVELSDQLRQRLQAVADATHETRDQIELSPAAVPAIRALEQAGAKVDSVAAWTQLAEGFARSHRLKPRPPKTLKAKLRDYQIEGHAWLTRVAAWGAGACLADDMGLGKTVQAIAVLLDRGKQGPALVLAPTSVLHNWVDELERFAPSLRPVLFTETDRATKLVGLKPNDVVIASYGVLVRDVDKLAAITFSTVVFDEAQALKNHATQRARAARSLQAEFRIGLSGTPFENHLGELWSLFSILFPGLFGSWDQFRERYAIPIERHHDSNAQASLTRVLSPFLLRRTKQEVARELPARTEIEISVTLSDEERALYEDGRIAALAELDSKGEGMRDERRRFQVLAAITRLRLLACHPQLYDPQSTLPSSKLARAVELLEELRASGHRALVFSQFTSHLALVRRALEEASFSLLYLDGSTPANERKRLVGEFQTGSADAFLISLKAGGQGINLTGADYVLHLDPWWNPAVEDQATDRAHRIGQHKPVTVYRLIAKSTIEDQILALHKDKRALVANILAGTGTAAKLTTKDLLALIRA
jgi:superfamily II DNA or RNA helicase